MDNLQISQDGMLTKLLDGAAILIVGIVTGVALANTLATTKTETLRPVQIMTEGQRPEVKIEGTVDAPLYPGGPKVEEG